MDQDARVDLLTLGSHLARMWTVAIDRWNRIPSKARARLPDIVRNAKQAYRSVIEQVASELRQTLPLLVITELIVHVINPFGIEEAIEVRASRVIQQIAAPSVAARKAPHIDGQKIVTVVLIDRAFAAAALAPADGAAAEPVWPLPVATLMRGVINPIITAKPAALFIDLTFPNAPRELSPGAALSRMETAAKLADYLTDISNNSQSVPVFVSDVVDPDEMSSASAQCGLNYVAADAVSKSSETSQALRHALFVPNDGKVPAGPLLSFVDSEVRDADGFYQLVPLAVGPPGSCHGAIAAGTVRYISSPALALYRAYIAHCNDGTLAPPDRCEVVGPGRTGSDEPTSVESIGTAEREANGMTIFAVHDFEAERWAMDLRWRSKMTPEFTTAYAQSGNQDRCDSQINPGGLDAVRRFLVIAAGNLAPTSMRESDRRPCVYIDTIAAGDLLKASQPGATSFNARMATFADTFIAGRVVLVGVATDITQAADSFESPVNGRIAGVYVHAAAVENLLTRGEGFARAYPGWKWWPTVGLIDTALVALLLSLRAALSWLLEHVMMPVGSLVIAPIVYLLCLFLVGWGVVASFAPHTPLPMVDIALPLVVLHVKLFEQIVHRAAEYALSKAGLRKGAPRHI